MRKEKSIMIVIIAAFIMIIFLYSNMEVNPDGSEIVRNLFYTSKIVEYPVQVSISDSENSTKIGVSIDTCELNFGILPLNSKATKYINLTGNEKAKVHIIVFGEIKDMIEVEKNHFITQGKEKIPIILHAKNPGNFSGTIQVIINKPKSWTEWAIGWM